MLLQAARAAALEALRQQPGTGAVQAAVAKAPSGEGRGGWAGTGGRGACCLAARHMD